jgi:hypothetical protein
LPTQHTDFLGRQSFFAGKGNFKRPHAWDFGKKFRRAAKLAGVEALRRGAEAEDGRFDRWGVKDAAKNGKGAFSSRLLHGAPKKPKSER